MLDAAYYAARGLSSIYKKDCNRKRLDFEDGMTLLLARILRRLGRWRMKCEPNSMISKPIMLSIDR